MADKLSIALSTYQYYERGERIPPADLLQRIVATFGVSSVWLLIGEGPMKKEEKEKASQVAEEPPPYFIMPSHVQALIEKLTLIYNEGDATHKALVRGVIENVYDEVKEKKQDMGSSENEGTESKSNTG